MARAIGMTEANYSSSLSKKRGLSAESTCLLLKFINLPKQQAVAKFSHFPITSKVMLLQEKGRSMRRTMEPSGTPTTMAYERDR
jgi:hypothetical protein